MKKGFSLVEVIIAITLLSVVMLSLLQIKENNIYLLKRIENSSLIDTHIALAAIFDHNDTDKKIYLNDLYDIKDDIIRKKIKDVSLELTTDSLSTIDIQEDNIDLTVDIFEKNYRLKDGSNKNIYYFKLDL